MQAPTDPRLIVLLPKAGLGVEAACWDRLHAAYSHWMRATGTYTAQTVGVLFALSVHTWAAYSAEQGRVAP